MSFQEQNEVETVGNRNYKDRRDFCMFCEKDVSHFTRHLATWHSAEAEVTRISSLSDAKERRQEYSSLRKRGNFLRNRTSFKIRPVKRLEAKTVTSSATDFLPCKHCLGFYKAKSLYRHTKRCFKNSEVSNGKRQTAKSDGQTTLLLGSLVKHDKFLTAELFPRMRPDEFSLIAKKDPLICHYAYSYLKGRRSKGNLDLVRQNIRRLAKLLKFSSNRDSDIRQLTDLLRPRHFHLIIDGANDIAQYNQETDKYNSPTLAMNFGTLLKKCCDLAFITYLQIPNSNEYRDDVITLKNLIISQWANEVSAQAGTNLNENRWNKEELIPLTTDLKKLNRYLSESATEEYDKLKNDNNPGAYYALKDILYTQILLLNRRRPAEVAQLKMETYKTINLKNSNQNTEFEKCLTETEKILLNTYSRFVIRGKRGRGVPILLSPTMKNHFDLLVSARDRLGIENKYIFHTKGNGFIDGTKILRKYVNKCEVECGQAITATRLRKHLATITQLLHFSNNDMEQLSKFMGHTLKTHYDVYRMSNDVYQTAKISKLLLLMMEGGAEHFKGKQLDEINISLTPVSENHDAFDELVQRETNEQEEFFYDLTETCAPEKCQKYTKQSWTDEQKSIVNNYFASNIKKKKPPTHIEVQLFMNVYPELFKNIKWTSLKAMVYNIYTGKLKIKKINFSHVENS